MIYVAFKVSFASLDEDFDQIIEKLFELFHLKLL